MKLKDLEELIKTLEENGQTKDADNLKILLSLLNYGAKLWTKLLKKNYNKTNEI